MESADTTLYRIRKSKERVEKLNEEFNEKLADRRVQLYKDCSTHKIH